MKASKIVVLVLLLGSILGCARAVGSQESSDKEIVSMYITFDKERYKIDFSNREAILNLPQEANLLGKIQFDISDGAVLMHDKFILIQGTEIQIEDGQTTFFSVVAEDESVETYKLTVITPRFRSKEIQWLKLDGISAQINDSAIDVNLPYGIDVKSIALDFEHNGVEASQKSGTKMNFSQKQTIAIRARDGSVRRYTFSIKVDLLEHIQVIGLKSKATNKVFISNRDESDNSFTIDLPPSFDPATDQFTLDMDVPKGYVSSLASGDIIEYKAGQDILFEVEPSQFTSIVYTIRINDPGFYERTFNIESVFSSFIVYVNGKNFATKLQENLIGVELPKTLKIKEVIASFELPDGLTASIVSGSVLDGIQSNEPFPFVVTSESGQEREFFLTLHQKALTTGDRLEYINLAFTSFDISINDIEYEVVRKDNQLNVYIPKAIELEKVVPRFVLGQGLSASINSGEILANINTNEAKVIILKSQTKEREFLLTIHQEELTFGEILERIDLSFKSFDLSVNGMNYDVRLGGNQLEVNIPTIVDLIDVVPTFVLASGLRASIASGSVIEDIRANKPKPITLTAQTGEKRDFFLTINRELSSVKKLQSLRLITQAGEGIMPNTLVTSSIDGHIERISVDLPLDVDVAKQTFSFSFEIADKRATLFLGENQIISQDVAINLNQGENTLSVRAEDGSNRKTVLDINPAGYFERAFEIEKIFKSFGMSVNGTDYDVELIGNEIRVKIPTSIELQEAIPTFELGRGLRASIESGRPLENQVDIAVNTPKEITITTLNGDYSEKFSIIINRDKSTIKNLLSLALKDNGKLIASTDETKTEQGHIAKITYTFPPLTVVPDIVFILDFTLDDKRAKLFFGDTELISGTTEISLMTGENILELEAEDGSRSQVILDVKVLEGDHKNSILTFEALYNDSIYLRVDIDKTDIQIVVPIGTGLNEAEIKYTIDELATKSREDGLVSFVAGEAQKFVVTSESGRQKVYTVSVVEDNKYLQKATRTTGRLLEFDHENYMNTDILGRTNDLHFHDITYGDNNFIHTIVGKGQSGRVRSQWEFVYDIYNRVRRMTNNDEVTIFRYAIDTILPSSSLQYVDGNLHYINEYRYDSQDKVTKIVKKAQQQGLSDIELNYRFINGNLASSNNVTIAEYDNSKNPFSNLMPEGFLQVAEFYEDYISENTPKVIQYKNIALYNQTFEEIQYNDEGYPRLTERKATMCHQLPEEFDLTVTECERNQSDRLRYVYMYE